jgi:hypothetical protein
MRNANTTVDLRTSPTFMNPPFFAIFNWDKSAAILWQIVPKTEII